MVVVIGDLSDIITNSPFIFFRQIFSVPYPPAITSDFWLYLPDISIIILFACDRRDSRIVRMLLISGLRKKQIYHRNNVLIFSKSQPQEIISWQVP
ncbi:hypothetical protein [Desulfonema ishimotonii]|uniref:hypothetical protein n=1 Tax=Desulfonema ishimotonii TaxID=45657 RepID=UPI000F56CD6F|nr:hypothetical protein [Desulfonema ishimotonii]